MIFGLFSDRRLDQFARGLAQELGARIAPATLGREWQSNTKLEGTLAKALQHVFLSVQNYGRTHKVGLLKKGRLSKIFQDELISLGYPEDFIKEVTWALAERLSKL
jgi:hypothetical protein